MLSPLPLPSVVHDRLDRLSQDLLGAAGAASDFSMPQGEAALVEPSSVSWRVFKNPIALFIGGVAAVVLELAHPRVRDGVWQHSSFPTDPLRRLQRTGMAAMVTVYAAESQARTMIRGVNRVHDRVSGTTSEGLAYRANDPRLLDWVQATAGFGFMQAHHTYVRPLAARQQDAFFAEGTTAARLYGATGAPRSLGDWNELLRAMEPHLAPSPVIFRFLEIMCRVDALPGPAHPLQHALVRAAVELVPPSLRRLLGLGADWSLSPGQRLSVSLAAKAADRLLLRSSPPVQACRRLGLPDDYRYRPVR